MLIEKSYTGNKSSIYKCDRCKKELVKGTDDIAFITGRNISTNKQLKHWHLCKRCFILFYKAIERGVKK